MKIKILATGGTIDKTYFDQKDAYHVGEPQAGGVLERANATIEFEVQSLMKKDSLEITEEDRELIRGVVESAEEDKIIITHGTDTMIQTAEKLYGINDKTIVFTGSMFPAQYRDSDAIFNLGSAVIATQTLPQGVYLAINGQIFDPRSSVKNVAKSRFERKA